VARIRTVKPEFWEDETIGTLSRDARLLFIATFNMADDEGLLRWTVAYIKAQAFLYDEDMSAAGVAELMNELVTAGLIYPYRAGKAQQQLAMIVNFHRHQKVNRPQPSKLPPPAWNNNQIAMVYARRDQFTCHLCGQMVNESWALKVDPYDSQQTDFIPLDPSPDHVIPRSLGGTDHPSNIKIAHNGCNKGRGNRAIEQFRMPDSVASCLRKRGVVPDSLIHSPSDSVNGSVPGSPPEGKGKEGKGVKTPVAVAPDPLFDEFWAAYPRKTDKGNARKAWTKAVKKREPQAIITAAAAYAATKPDPKFTAHPSTWLNGERWDDQPLTLIAGGLNADGSPSMYASDDIRARFQ
jgi:5-methylcytosine-specific restriction endonuclease McrA